MPHPDECELYYVERDTLFSYHKASEVFLQRIMSLYVSSHYKNSPNDLLLMSDAPAHQIFALLGPVNASQNALPDVLCVVQVALEGAISKKSAMTSLSQGVLPHGDLIPWTIGQQYQDPDFPGLSGARVVRIATHPELTRGGYGSAALKQLTQYFQGQLSGLDEGEGGTGATPTRKPSATPNGAGLLAERIKPRTGLPPLLVSLADRPPERLHYLGVSFGITLQLYKFWSRAGYCPVYVRQTANETTGEHTCVMLRPLESEDVEGTGWLQPFVADFKSRFRSLLGAAFREFDPSLALVVLDPKLSFTDEQRESALQGDGSVAKSAGELFTPYDLKRLQAYSSNLVDHHLVLDLVPSLAHAFFAERLPANLSYIQAAILLMLGLQQRGIDSIQKHLDLPSNQILALFNKAVRKVHAHIKQVKIAAVDRALPTAKQVDFQAHERDLDEDLEEAAEEVKQQMQERLNADSLQKYAISDAADFQSVLQSKAPPTSGLVSLKTDGKSQPAADMMYKKDKKGKKGGKSLGNGKKSSTPSKKRKAT